MSLRRPKLFALLAALLAVVLAVAGCSSSGDSSSGDGTRTVTTDQGTVDVPTDPKRVVLLNYSLAGYLFDLDVPVVAMTPQHTDHGGEFADSWKDAAEQQGTQWLPWSPDGFDTESILAQEPDLIIAGGIGFPLRHATEQYQELSEIAPTVVVSGDLTDWRQQYQFLADKVFDKPQVYQDALKKYDDRLAEVRDNITVPAGESSFISMLADGRPFVLVEDRGLPAEFKELGFRPAPLFASGDYQPYVPGGDSFELSTEQVGQVLTMPTLFIIGFQTQTQTVDELRKRPIFGQLPAFTGNQVYELPYESMRGDHNDALKTLDIVERNFGDKK